MCVYVCVCGRDNCDDSLVMYSGNTVLSLIVKEGDYDRRTIILV